MGALRNTSVHYCVLDFTRCSELVAFLFDLECKLTCGGEYEDNGTVPGLEIRLKTFFVCFFVIYCGALMFGIESGGCGVYCIEKGIRKGESRIEDIEEGRKCAGSCGSCERGQRRK